jgi:hypothetical protein
MEPLKVPPQRTGDVKRKFAQEEVRSDRHYRRNIPKGARESIERKPARALNLRSHSLDKLRQIVTTGAHNITHNII